MTKTEILTQTARLALVLNIVDVALSFVLSVVYLDTLDLSQVSGVFGNLTLIMAMLMFIYGGAVDFSGTAKWASAMNLLRIGKGEWKEGDSRKAERKAIVYILGGAVMLAETIVLAIITV